MLILAFSAWRLSLFKPLSFLTQESVISAETTALQLRFDTVRRTGTGAPVIKDLRFYVHDLQLLASDGQVFPIHLDNADGEHGIALIDMSRQRSVPLPARVSSATLSADINAVAFKLGVPFALNHANPLTARTPLNESAMYWVWQQGYKFFKLDSTSASGEGVSFHLGSAGCESESALRPPIVECRYPNRVSIVLGLSGSEGLVIQVNPWVVLQAMQNHNMNLCSAAANFTDACAAALSLFGIDPVSDRCVGDCRIQQVFTAKIMADADE